MSRSALCLLTICILVPSLASAGPILKPRKYFGPIPANSLSIHAGFLGNATNEQMFNFLDGLRNPPEQALSDDFSNAPSFNIVYMRKPHPQFGIRAALSATFLRSSGRGFFVDDAAGLPDSVLAPVLDYTREFNVNLFSIEASAVYYLADASVQDFQPYLAGGFSFGVPNAHFTEDRTNRDTGAVVTIMRDKTSVEAGVHAGLGALYYITNLFAVSSEARYQIMQSTFPAQAINEDGEPEDVNFVVNYGGFFLSLGLTRGF